LRRRSISRRVRVTNSAIRSRAEGIIVLVPLSILYAPTLAPGRDADGRVRSVQVDGRGEVAPAVGEGPGDGVEPITPAVGGHSILKPAVANLYHHWRPLCGPRRGFVFFDIDGQLLI
jgi:hypothetical protein